jgi:hypothetical protein
MAQKTNKQNCKIGMVYNPVLLNQLFEKLNKTIYVTKNYPRPQ